MAWLNDTPKPLGSKAAHRSTLLATNPSRIRISQAPIMGTLL